MAKNSWNFSQEDIQRLAGDPAARKLMALLRSDPDTLSGAAEQAASGDYRGAIGALSDILARDDIKALLAQLGGTGDG